MDNQELTFISNVDRGDIMSNIDFSQFGILIEDPVGPNNTVKKELTSQGIVGLFMNNTGNLKGFWEAIDKSRNRRNNKLHLIDKNA